MAYGPPPDADLHMSHQNPQRMSHVIARGGDGEITMDGSNANVSMSKEYIKIGCHKISIGAAKWLVAEHDKRFTKDEWQVIQP